MFYKEVFGTEFEGGGFVRFSDMPPMEGQPSLQEADKKLIMHVSLPILGGHRLMGTDAPESMGFRVTPGNNVYILLSPDTRSELDELFAALSKGGKVETPPQEMFWGDYYASCADRFGVQWMFTCSNKE
jgi:PhnB protein